VRLIATRVSGNPKVLHLVMVVVTCLWIGGCHHQIRFEEINHSVGQEKIDVSIVAVIAPETLSKVTPIHSIMTGAAHTWEARPGEMLQQMTDLEFPQVFQHYRRVPIYEDPTEGQKRLTVELSVQHYDFSDFHATVVVQAKVYSPGRIERLERSYRGAGKTQGAKMFWGGAFAMKSAIRQSSYDAYKKLFEQLRRDLMELLRQP
jgi:hypothetical protein